jgi:hypothetical protein
VYVELVSSKTRYLIGLALNLNIEALPVTTPPVETECRGTGLAVSEQSRWPGLFDKWLALKFGKALEVLTTLLFPAPLGALWRRQLASQDRDHFVCLFDLHAPVSFAAAFRALKAARSS